MLYQEKSGNPELTLGLAKLIEEAKMKDMYLE
jgi:hypothetical protein